MKKQFVLDNEIIDVDVIEENPSFVLFNFNGEEYSVSLGGANQGKMVLNLKGKNRPIILADKHYVVDGREFIIEAPMRSRSKTRGPDLGQMKSPMPGKILKIFVKVGDTISIGSPLLVMEAMKMEHTIKSSKEGKIEAILYKEGDQVAGGVELIKLC